MTKRINISIPEEIIKKIDIYKEKIQISRSGFILNALKNYFKHFNKFCQGETI